LVFQNGDPFNATQSCSPAADGQSCDPDARSSAALAPPQERTPHHATKTLDHSIRGRDVRKARERELYGSPSQQGEQEMITHKGKCFCGAVEIEVNGVPEAMGYCHCSSCRSWSAAPVNAFTLWKPQNVRVTKGAEYIGKFARTEASHRQYCKRCGGHLMTDHPTFGLVDVYAATIPTLKFTPGVHVNFGDGIADERRVAEAEGFSRGIGRLGCCCS
jgi:hypothetical protein